MKQKNSTLIGTDDCAYYVLSREDVRNSAVVVGLGTNDIQADLT